MAREFQRGHKAKISDLTAGTDLYVGVQIGAPGLTFDISCFGLDAGEQLTDDRYFIFFNQPKSPEESIQLLGAQAGDTESFRVTLDRIPAHIHKLSFTATIDGAGQMSQVSPGYIRVVAGGEEVARYSFNGSEFSTERAVMLGDFYLKDVWRFAAVGQGFDGGLEALLKNFGGEVEEEQQPAAPAPQPGATPGFAPPGQSGPPQPVPQQQPAPSFGAPAQQPAPQAPAPQQPAPAAHYTPPQGSTPPPAPAPAVPPVHAAQTIAAPLHTQQPYGQPPHAPQAPQPPQGYGQQVPGQSQGGQYGYPQGAPAAPGPYGQPGQQPPPQQGQYPPQQHHQPYGQQGMPPQGIPQGMPPQGMPPQGMPPQGIPPQGIPPQGAPQTAPGLQAALQKFRETPTGQRWTPQNEQLMRVDLGNNGTPVLARQGSMVMYQGKVDFSYKGAGFKGRVIGNATGQEMQLMRCSGQGQVFFAENAAHLHPIELQGDGICVSAENVLAFDETLTHEVRRIEGHGIPGGALFTMMFHGTGTVIVKTQGIPVVLPVTPTTFADSNAIVAWSAASQVILSSQVRLRRQAFPGHSGETVNLQFRGAPGNFIVVQPYEV
ncbi:TerD family protein [Streptomyces sp. NBC_00237]|uniref:TerD family protein n=1 Tax=Streptomyces sp. NBC_00237 TaxID=2975687 RepID=UPI00224C8530|nr:TerD family protein [Streptomyces sp. NBC_00237]MCX5204354.1 TerD family protein [Streptomyces sp. NBC_00237]